MDRTIRRSGASSAWWPRLITVGRHDEITPACAETLHRGIAGSRIRVFEHSAHMAHAEETALYLSVVADLHRSAERADKN